MRVYRIEQDAVTPSLTLVDELCDGLWPDYLDPVVDSAQFLNQVYCLWLMSGGPTLPKILLFDVTTEH